MSGVLRGFPSAAYCRVRLRRKPLCGLAHRKNLSFMNWKLTVLVLKRLLP